MFADCFNMPIDFYHAEGSPPCGLVEMVAEAIDLELNYKAIDFKGGEHLKPEFLKVKLIWIIKIATTRQFW